MASREDILKKLDELMEQLRDIRNGIIRGDQIAIDEGLSDIDENLGSIRAGSVRFGTGDFGKGFTGLRLGYPQFTYGSTDYVMAGVDNDTMLWGVRSSDGSLDYSEDTGWTIVYSSDMIGGVNYTTDEASPFYELAAYKKVGTVGYLRGLISPTASGNTTSQTVFIIDSDHRPTYYTHCVAMGADAIGSVRISTDGDVICQGSTAWFTLNGVTWNIGEDT